MTDKLSMTSPLVPLASNELFERRYRLVRTTLAISVTPLERISAAPRIQESMQPPNEPCGLPWHQASCVRLFVFARASARTFELTGRREFIQASPDQ